MQDNKNIYTVSRLNTEVRQVLENSFPLIWVEGEISNFSAPRSGHIYFTLKDAHAQVRCAMFRMKRQLLRFQPENGMKVLIRARITLYEARGDFQLVSEHMEPAGEGLLRQQIEELKQRLQAEGLFDAAHKQALPALPSTIGVVTSATGAAVRDVLNVFKRRFPGLAINIYPVPVQGDNAAAEITAMLKLVDKRGECDLVILTRGGGSLEDLMAFNDEQLARTIFAMQTPVISAVGHEIDTSISDFVADRRAPTPSAAAELASPDRDHLLKIIDNRHNALKRACRQKIQTAKQKLKHQQQRLQSVSPQRKLQLQQQSLDLTENRLLRSAEKILSRQLNRFAALENRLRHQSPENRIKNQSLAYRALKQRLMLQNPLQMIHQKQQWLLQQSEHRQNQLSAHLQQLRQQLANMARVLESVSPLATLSRGYAIVQDENDSVIRSVKQVEQGQQISARVEDGIIIGKVDSIQ